jgi:bacterial/archaeal transporter family-2 protein
MMIGFMFAVVAGSLVGLQNIFNSKVNERVGSWTTTTLVLGLGFLASLTMGFLFNGKQFFTFDEIKPWYWMSGFIGVGVVTSFVRGLRYLGPTYAVSIAMTSQLALALLLDSFGWLGLEKVPFTLNQLAGVLVIVSGIIVFKLGGSRTKVSEAEVKGYGKLAK